MELLTPQALRKSDWKPEPHQIPPACCGVKYLDAETQKIVVVDPPCVGVCSKPGEHDPDWEVWILLGGRGSGKTDTGAHHVLDHLWEMGSRARVGIMAPTIGDVRDTVMEGISGLVKTHPEEFTIGGKLTYNRSLGEAWHVAGGYVKAMGSEEPTRWNGPNWSLLWADELALSNQESYEQAQFGLRIGDFPKTFISTTPKNRKFVKEIAADPKTALVLASTFLNPHLSQKVRDKYERKYGGTTLGRQELYAEFIGDVEGALWQREWIDNHRKQRDYQDCERIIVAIDPATTAKKKSNQTGIVVEGKLGNQGFVYVAEGAKLSPRGWAQRAVELYYEYEADAIVAERNNGGEMVEANIKEYDANVNVKTIHNMRGKRLRAEPTANRYQGGRIHHTRPFHELEDQQCAFVSTDQNEGDDLVDALVFADVELFEGGGKYSIPMAGRTIKTLADYRVL